MAVELIDAYAMGGAVSLGTIAALNAMAWRTLRRRWCASFALGYAVGALLYGLDRIARPTGAPPNPWTAALAIPALMLFVDGMVDYVALPARTARWLRGAAVGLGLVYLAPALAQAVPR